MSRSKYTVSTFVRQLCLTSTFLTVHAPPSPLASYNSLADEHLAHYYSNPRIRRHLLRAGLVRSAISGLCEVIVTSKFSLWVSQITRDGCIVDELSYRESVARREHQDHVKNLLAQTIIDKALDMEVLILFI